MYRAFNLRLGSLVINEAETSAAVQAAAQKVYEETGAKVEKSLDDYLRPDGRLDAAKIKIDWFRDVRADIFLSHSHEDLEVAARFGGVIKHFVGLQCFVDSLAWGHCDTLLRKIDDIYCWRPASETYSYETRNRSTAHVHAIVATALAKMIDKSECLFFLNSPRSMTPSDVVGDASGTTPSPWIYSEIAMTHLIRRRSRDEHRGLVKAALSKADALKNLGVAHEVNLDHLTELTADDIIAWIEQVQERGGVHPLDVLYGLHPE